MITVVISLQFSLGVLVFKQLVKMESKVGARHFNSFTKALTSNFSKVSLDFPFSIDWTFLEHKADISLFKTPPMVFIMACLVVLFWTHFVAKDPKFLLISGLQIFLRLGVTLYEALLDL